MVRYIAILILCLSAMASAITGDLNSDGRVSLPDLILFSDSWLSDDGGDFDADDDTDFADFAILASHWMEGCGNAPSVDASNVSAGCAANGEVTITLTAQSSSALTYQITSLPIDGLLYEGQTMIATVPRTLSGNQVRYVGSEGSDSFNWSAVTSANDCGVFDIDGATVTITVYIVPTATAQSVTGTAYIWQSITLAATDDGLPTPPGKLRYIITTLPAIGLLYDPKSGAGQINKVPYTLSSWGTDVLYICATTGNSSFGFKATDSGVSPLGGESLSAATVSITTAANPLDCLSFDGFGYVTIPDGTYFDAVDGWAVDVWVKTRSAYAMLIDKRTAGAGYEIKLVAGRPYIMLVDTAGTVYYLMGDRRIDNDQWQEIEFVTYSTGTGWAIYLSTRNIEEQYAYYSGAFPDFSNAEPVVIGNGFKGQVDKLRYYSGITNPTAFESIVQFAERTETTTSWEMTPNVQFNCDEGTGTTITDSKTSKVGTFSSADHVAWHPWIVPFTDVSVQQYYRGAR
jgi:hypothetical protein